ncbi:MAG TPA: hypothetical protein VK820_08200 [Steroidobacteraceae bacterium]|jgi:hypothetical protein|nr:hypothetical protein [Steroidobacteraceae bacterium]
MESLVNADRPVAGAANESSRSAVSWPAIIAGAVVATAASVLLLALGSGLGLISTSPSAATAASAGAVTALAAIWLIAVQWIASGLGGYLTGRMRTKWVGTHDHEVFFRDTAHGFVTWALATVLMAIVIASTASAMIGTGVRAGATLGTSATQGATSMERGYDVDVLFRSTQPGANAPAADVRAETTRILAKDLTMGDVSAADRAYVAQLIAARTGISQADAQKRVDDVVAKARQAAEAARKAAATASILAALSMLIGAFIACAAAALGGRERDLHP